MATTQMALVSERYGARAHISGSVATVALDAQVAEFFQIPTGFGDLLLDTVWCQIDTLSGAYVAPAPAYDGIGVSVLDSVATTTIDKLFVKPFTHIGTSSARPLLAVSYTWDRNVVIVRQRDIVWVSAPILAGGGVTGTVRCHLTGIRLRQT